jgi:hypothetical protein
MTIEATPTASAAMNQFVRIGNESSVPVVANDRAARIAELFHEAAETHHTVYRITDGDDPDWASWYADWLLGLSELPDELGMRPVRSHLVHALVDLDREYTSSSPAERWEDWYAAQLVERFGA